jgi:hypothetical protein
MPPIPRGIIKNIIRLIRSNIRPSCINPANNKFFVMCQRSGFWHCAIATAVLILTLQQKFDCSLQWTSPFAAAAPWHVASVAQVDV